MGRTNKYHQILNKILDTEKCNRTRKATSGTLLDERLRLTPSDLLDIFETHGIARKKLRAELSLFMRGERSVEKYREGRNHLVGLLRGATLVNSYPDLL